MIIHCKKYSLFSSFSPILLYDRLAINKPFCYLQTSTTLMFKVKHKLCPKGISELFNLRNSSYSLRSADFTIPRFNTVTYGKHSTSYLGPKLWNKLSSEVRNLESLSQFKHSIRKINVQLLLDENSCSGCTLCNS